MAKKTVETRRKEPRADRDGRQYVAVHRNYLGLATALLKGECYLATTFQCQDGKLVRLCQSTFLQKKDANAFVRSHVGPGKMRAAMTPEQHAERIGWIKREPNGMAAYQRRIRELSLRRPESHKVVVNLPLYVDDGDIEAVASRGFSDRRRAKLSEIKRWAEVTLLGQLQLAREHWAAELAGERTGRA